MPKEFEKLLNGNKRWLQKMNKDEPELFDSMAEGQEPPYLWIGCADSRVPAEEITSSLPGSIFVQRNIANVVVHTDYNLLSVVNYAVKALKVNHIIICGHYGCGGVKAAMGKTSFGLLDNWLTHIKDVYKEHKNELGAIEDEDTRWKRFVELNVQEQVNNMARLSFIQEEWKNGQFPYIHGWVFNVENGELIDLKISINSTEGLDDFYKLNV
ncbi:MAG: carbonic anhydrase [Flammeovirgaceae bacterium]|jgi:carbonic anhydrase